MDSAPLRNSQNNLLQLWLAMVHHFGKAMTAAAAESLQGYSSVFNSSVPQRPVEKTMRR
jgi:hypothetical protein